VIAWQENALIRTGRKYALQQIALMVFAVLIYALITYFVWGLSHTYSVLAGGMVAIIPNIVFAYKAFKYAGATASRKVMTAFFSGVKIKLGLTALLFALIFKFLVIIPLPFFTSFCLIMALPLLTPFLLKN